MSLVISDYFRKATNQLWIENSKNDWTKRLQKILRKINLSLSLAKRKLAEKNEWNLSNHACFDIPRKLQKKLHFFQLPYLKHDFMITNLVRLN